MAKFIPYESRVAGAALLIAPTKETLNGIAEFIRWCEEEVPRQLPQAMNQLVLAMALVNQGEARKMSFGPYDPTGRKNPGAAWGMPVRRISENYYLGWKIRQIRPGVVQLYNDSREAYFIEFGINWLGAGRRVRRPIRKLSLLKTLRILEQTNVYDRVWASIFIHKGKGYGFTQRVQSPGGGHMRWENISTREYQSMVRGGTAQAGMFRTNENGQRQIRRANRGGGTYGGPKLGRRLP